MKNVFASAVISLTLASLSSAAFAQEVRLCTKKIGFAKIKVPCGISEPTPSAPQPKLCAQAHVGGNLDNAHMNVYDQQKATDLGSHKYATRTWHGGLRQKWTGKDRYWRDISSARVQPGCRLTVYSDNLTTVYSQLTATNVAQDYTVANFPGAGAVGSLACVCGDEASVINLPEVDPFGFSMIHFPAPTKD